MKKILLLFFLSSSLFANHVYWQGIYDKALEEAHQENKPLLVLVVKKREPFCNEIIKNVFMNQAYIEKINSKIIAIIVTYEGKMSYPIELYYTTVFPTLFFVDAQKETFLREPLFGKEITTQNVQAFLEIEKI